MNQAADMIFEGAYESARDEYERRPLSLIDSLTGEELQDFAGALLDDRKNLCRHSMIYKRAVERYSDAAAQREATKVTDEWESEQHIRDAQDRDDAQANAYWEPALP